MHLQDCISEGAVVFNSSELQLFSLCRDSSTVASNTGGAVKPIKGAPSLHQHIQLITLLQDISSQGLSKSWEFFHRQVKPSRWLHMAIRSLKTTRQCYIQQKYKSFSCSRSLLCTLDNGCAKVWTVG